MRIVRFSPQERVDLPDLSAISHLANSEFRRTVRAALLGPRSSTDKTSSLLLLRGFAVTPAAIPDATVTITIDPGGGLPISAGFLGEDLGSHVDTGYLAGAEDSAQRLESNALGSVDFTALAGLPTNYFVEMRALYVEGEADNRVFRRESDGTQFVARAFTRLMPALQFQAVPTTSGGDWLPLALVSWDGVSIDAADITDVRSFVVEGSALAFQTADGDQDSTEGFGDFSRDADRATYGVNEVYPALRAGNRQIRDLKGPTWVDGVGFKWDWFSRPLAPKDYSGLGLPFGDQHTKHLGSVETTTYTVGDGFNTHGDFNGAAGLEQALEALSGSANPLGRPRRARIVIKGDTRSSITYTLTQTFDFTADGALHLTIEAVSANGADGDSGRAEIEATVAGTNFSWITARGVTLRNLKLTAVNSSQGLISAQSFIADNCELRQQIVASDLTAGNYVLRIERGSAGLPVEIKNSDIIGHLFLVDDTAVPSIPFNRVREAVIENCDFSSNSHILLNDASETAPTGLHSYKGVRFTACRVIGGSTIAARGMVDGRNAENVVFERCHFQQGTRDMDVIHCGIGTSTKPTSGWRVVDCQFNLASARVAAFESGLNGVDGTGWGIFVQNTNGLPVEIEADIEVTGCRFEGPGDQVIMDSGAVHITDAAQASVTRNHFYNFGARSGNRTVIVQLVASGGRGGAVTYNRFDKFAANTSSGTVIGVQSDGADKCKINHNVFFGKSSAGAAVNMALASCAIDVRNTQGFEVVGNEVEGFDNATAAIEIENDTANLVCEDFAIRGNIFIDVCDTGGSRYAIKAATSAGVATVRYGIISDNQIKQSAAADGIYIPDALGLTVNNNNIHILGTGTVAIAFGTLADECMCSGNRTNGGSITAGGAGSIYGVQNSTRNDLNG